MGMAAKMGERTRMARELHDTLEQLADPQSIRTDAVHGRDGAVQYVIPTLEGSRALQRQPADEVVIAGERNLLSVTDFASDMNQLRRTFDLFEQKTQLLHLLDTSAQAQGVRIYIGGESHIVPFEELSVVSAPYKVDGQIVGTLGVIGPTRMPYERMIRIVDITSKLVSNALSHQK